MQTLMIILMVLGYLSFLAGMILSFAILYMASKDPVKKPLDKSTDL